MLFQNTLRKGTCSSNYSLVMNAALCNSGSGTNNVMKSWRTNVQDTPGQSAEVWNSDIDTHFFQLSWKWNYLSTSWQGNVDREVLQYTL